MRLVVCVAIIASIAMVGCEKAQPEPPSVEDRQKQDDEMRKLIEKNSKLKKTKAS